MRFKAIFALLAGLVFASAAFGQTPTPEKQAVLDRYRALITPPPLTPENTLVLDLSTGGRVSIQLRPEFAPNHVERIKTLARRGFYNGVTFHRVIEGFMAQTGDPQGTGEGGSELPDLVAEFNGLPHVRGAVSMARTTEPNTANSQFFIMLTPRLSLDRKYTVFGRVVSGMNFVDAIERGEPPENPSRIVQASIGSDNVAPPAPGQVVPRPPQPEAPSAPPPPQAPAPEIAPDAALAPAPAPAADAPVPAAEAPVEEGIPPSADAAPADQVEPAAQP